MEFDVVQLIGALAALLAIFTGSNVAYTHWRLGKLEGCIDRAHLRLDSDMQSRARGGETHG